MFRNPRESSEISRAAAILGRPPTPPSTPTEKGPLQYVASGSATFPKMTATKTKPGKAVPLPTIGRQGFVGSARKGVANSKIRQKPNGSILSFFKKSDDPSLDGLFVEEKYQAGSSTREEVEGDPAEEPADTEDVRFNENEGSLKRRRTSTGGAEDDSMAEQPSSSSRDPTRKAGPFVEDSDSEHDGEAAEALITVKQNDDEELTAVELPNQVAISTTTEDEETNPDSGGTREERDKRSPLIKEESSFEPALNDFQDFDELGDFEEDVYEEGDEYMERRYMEEQALLEAEENDKAEKFLEDGGKTEFEPENSDDAPAAETVPGCPICSVSLDGVSEQDAAIHVNNCLDGNPTALPERKQSSTSAPVKTESGLSANHFRRPVRAAKPGQASPFTLGESSISGGSAFNKLMSGHAEDAAWAEAAASENAARGKPSYQRTCPFYKILPGLFICVDAFRYGAVQGCQAYFLSHFHSDHYVGLTSYWCHGPIYCSKVTANLVLQQLRVDPKYVIPLEWETPFEVPGTKGVKVTMISANHCPGSSLYLFEKTVGRKQNGEPRMQRILHCGDFRACRTHIEHPLLMPEVQDKLTGKPKEQVIDVCYLDTTYLNPKYAFPSQEAVIKACADMCVCLSKDAPDESDGWEQMKRLRAGEGMVRFVRKESAPEQPVPSSSTTASSGTQHSSTMTLTPNPAGGPQPILSSALSDRSRRGRLLVVVGTYSIGKERICLGIARALNSKIYAPPSKHRIILALEDPSLSALLTSDPLDAQVHMTALFEIRAETLDDYLRGYSPHFTRCVGFRPTGWSYRPPNSRFVESPPVSSVLHSENWKSDYSMRELVPQRGSSGRASCFGVPYSEHSSFRELTVFCCALRIEKVVPTVNVGSAKSRERMKAWCERWAAERRKNGLYRLPPLEEGGL